MFHIDSIIDALKETWFFGADFLKYSKAAENSKGKTQRPLSQLLSKLAQLCRQATPLLSRGGVVLDRKFLTNTTPAAPKGSFAIFS